MKLKNILLLLLLMGSFTVVFAQGKAPQQKITVVKDSLQENIFEISNKLEKIYQLQENIQQTRQAELDSVLDNKKERRRSDIGIMRDIAINTKEDFVKSGWTLFAILTFVISFIVSIFTWWSQWRTEKHTKNVSVNSQLGMLDDLPRHFYRNLACTVAMLLKYRHKDNITEENNTFKAYPSEANVLKLQTLPEEFILPIDMASDKVFDEMHEQKLLFKNYNIEVAAASEHFSRKHIKEKSLVNDYDNLLFKPIFLITRLCDLYEMLKKSKQWNREEYVCNVICTFVMEHFCKLSFKNIEYGIQKQFLREIHNDKDFEKYIKYDVSTKYDNPGSPIYCNGIERSAGFLLGLLKKCNLNLFIQKEENDYIINREKFVEYFLKIKVKEIGEKEKGEIINDVLKPEKIENTMEKYKIDQLGDKTHQEAVKSYLEFWQKDEWTLKELLNNMLKMDAVLELPKIGMIEH